MKVILKQAVPKVGKAGQVVNVKGGYARNFLFPKGIAVVADKGQLKAQEVINARLSSKLAETKAGAEALASKLNGQTVVFDPKVGDGGRLFGAVTAQDIADQIKSTFGVDVDKKDIALLQPIKRVGKYPVEVDVHREVDIKMTIRVGAEESVAEPEAVTEAPAVEEVADEPTEETVEA